MAGRQKIQWDTIPRLLVVDDEPEVVALLEKYLKKKGLEVRTAGNGVEALQILADFPADVVLTDLQMPEVDGLLLAEKLRELNADTEVIILTGHGTLESAIEALRLQNVFDYMLKPLDVLAELEHTIMRALEFKQMRQQNASLLGQLQSLNENLSQRVIEQTQELQKAYDELKEMERLKSEFLANISHELQSPLTPLEGYIGMFLEGELGPLQGEQEEVMETLQSCVIRLKRQVDNILYLVMLDADSVQVILDNFSFHDVLRSFSTTYAQALAEKKQRLHLNLDANNAIVRADLQQMTRVLNILLENALQFSQEGSTIFVKTSNISGRTLLQRTLGAMESNQLLFSFLEPDLPPDQSFLEVSIQDRGRGIPEQKLPFIFHTFFQADGSMTRDTSGIGLGLSIARKILASHGSLIYVESQENMGTLVSFVLPVA